MIIPPEDMPAPVSSGGKATSGLPKAPTTYWTPGGAGAGIAQQVTFSWNYSAVPPRPSAVPATLTVAACLLATIAIGGCANSTRALNDTHASASTPGPGSLTDREFKVAVAVARAEADKEDAAITSATATVGEGTVTDPNAGPPCTSGTLLHIKLIGAFPHIVIGLGPTAGAPSDGKDYSVTTVLITADPASGKACEIGVRTDPATPDPGATLLFTK